MAEALTPTCHTCPLVCGESFPGEVWYDAVKRWSCLKCHLVEKGLQVSKCRAVVKRICRKCDGCSADLSADPNSVPRWYCYDCSQFLCNKCTATHKLKNHRKERILLRTDNASACDTARCRSVRIARPKRTEAIKPSPGLEFPEYHFVKQIQVDKSPKDNERGSKEIAKWTTALMNTSGGLIVLYCTKPDSDQQRDRWLMGLESVLTNKWIPESTFQSLVRFQYLEIGDQLRIYMFVDKAPHVITFSYNAYGRQTTGIRSLRDATRVQQMLNEAHAGSSSVEWHPSMEKRLAKFQSFKINDPIPTEYRENETMEFKHCYSDRAKKKELHSLSGKEFKQRLIGDGGYIQYISAFANTHGGSLALGVEEGGKFPVVRGFIITEDEKQKIHDCLHAELDKCLWHGDPKYKPYFGHDWKLMYHNVLEQGGTSKRQLIEICIPKHAGGMFVRSPIYYLVSKYGKLESNMGPHSKSKSQQKDEPNQHEMFEKWKKEFHAPNGANYMYELHTKCSLRSHWNRTPEGGTAEREQNKLPSSVLKYDLPATTAAAAEEDRPDDLKLPKSFRESQSEHKTDINVLSLSLRDCCSTKMAKSIQNLEGTKHWCPHWETMRGEFPEDARFDELVAFIGAGDWNGIATVIDRNTDTDINTGKDEFDVANSRLICHVLITRKGKTPILICCIRDKSCSGRTREDLDKLVGFAVSNGRKLKRRYLTTTVNNPYRSCMFHFVIHVLIVPTVGDITKVWDSSWTDSQPVIYPQGDTAAQYSLSCNALAEWLLKTRYSVRDRYGEILTEHLTEAQARVLFDRNERVLIVRGKSGTGKTVIALHLVHEALSCGLRDEDVLYICSSAGVEAYVSAQVPCRVMVVKTTDCLSSEQKDFLSKMKLIIVDYIHAIQLGAEWKGSCDTVVLESDPTDLYRAMFLKAAHGSKVAIFFDPDQDYEGHLPAEFDKRLRDLAESVEGLLPQDIRIVTLGDRIRNSREINRFMQANQNQAKVGGTISCLNEEDGDDIVYGYIGRNLEDSANLLNEKLGALEKKYNPKSIAIVCDDTDQRDSMRRLLLERFHRIFQTARQYPVRRMVLCSLEDFGGLEAHVVLFLLPPKFETEAIKVPWKYINTISSRAKQRIEFLLPWEPQEKASKQGKIHRWLRVFKRRRGRLRSRTSVKQRNIDTLLELFKRPPLDYGGLTVTGRTTIQAGYELWGLCYSDSCLYTGEWRKVGSGKYSWTLAAYRLHCKSGNITLLDRLELGVAGGPWFVNPRIEHHSRRVFVPYYDRGVAVARLDGDRLVRETVLTCVRFAVSVDVMSPYTVYVCDREGRSVHVVDVRVDRIRSTLITPEAVRGERPDNLGVLGDSVMVGYYCGPLVIYRHGISAPIKVIPRPGGLQQLLAISTDCERHFILTDYDTKSICQSLLTGIV